MDLMIIYDSLIVKEMNKPIYTGYLMIHFEIYKLIILLSF